MKTDGNKKLLKLVSAETLIQLGFEKVTEQSLNVMSDLLGFYIETLVRKIVPIQNIVDPFLICNYLVDDTYFEATYCKNEMFTFLDQQINLKIQLKEKHDIDGDESLLHSLKILPKGVTFRSVLRNTKGLTVEDKKTIETQDSISTDEFMNEFIEKSSSEQNRRVVGAYNFDFSTITEGQSRGGVVFEACNKKVKDMICGNTDCVLAEQELFIEDFYGNDKYHIIR